MPDADLAELARRYLRGGLDRRAAATFEDRLGTDQAARDALCAAVGPLEPDPSYRGRVRRRLRPPLWRRLLAPRAYRGHPLLWSMAGAAAVLLGVLLWPDSPAPVPTPAPAAVTVSPVAPPAEAVAPTPQDARATARLWAERCVRDRLAGVLAEENRRHGRTEDRRLAREEGGLKPFTPPMEKP